METLADRKKNRIQPTQKETQEDRNELWESVEWKVNTKGNLNKWFRTLGLGVTIFPRYGSYRYCIGDKFSDTGYKTIDEARDAVKLEFLEG